ncbi:MAG: hypothetical protein IPM53_08245 [Anaerolineaceae bacterium]|nr:hypothetical protein [Anaerolineaceae bacterium]
MELFLATENGVWLAQPDGDSWKLEKRGLDGRIVTSIMAREGVILAGTTDGIFRSDDRGASWFEQSYGLSQRHVRWLAFHPDISDLEFAGTEPAALFVSQDGGESWVERPEVAELRDEFGWWLPYSPEAGCVRGFAFHGQHAFAAVEVGGLLRSDDGGDSWQLAEGSNGRPQFGRPADGLIHPDVHSIAVHPSSHRLLYAPTGGGFYRSTDGGASWQGAYLDCYARAVWVNPANSEELVLGPAEDASGRNGRIEHSTDGGQTWRRLTEPQNRSMVERFVAVEDHLFAVMSNGALWHSPLPQQNWTPILPQSTNINAACAIRP